MLTIDVHTHFVPFDVIAAAWRGAGFDGLRAERAGGTEWLVHRQGFRFPVPPVFYDPQARLASMDERGIGHAVLSVAPQLFMYWTDGTEAAGFCRAVNDDLAAFADGSAGRITAVATLPLQNPAASPGSTQYMNSCGAIESTAWLIPRSSMDARRASAS